MNKTFRGILNDLEQQRIRLSTNNGLKGYKIVKLEIISLQPGAVDGEHVVQVYTVSHTDTSRYDNIDFNDPTLLAVAFNKTDSSEIYSDTNRVVFDNMIFNQDIFISHADIKGSLKVNYMIELEPVALSNDEATVATLKDMRGRE